MRKFKKFRLCSVLICISLFLTGCGTQYIGGDRNKKWIKDLNYLRDSLKMKHPNLYYKTSEEEFDKEINDVQNNIQNLNDQEVINSIYKIAASVGDGHTKAVSDYSKRYPVQFYYFNDDICLINTTEEYKQAFNCKLKKVNGIDIKEVEKILTPLVSNENEQCIKKLLPNMLSRPDILQGEKITDTTDSINFTFEDLKGKEFNLSVSSVKIENNDIEWCVENYNESYPLYMQNRDLSYWYKYLEDKKVLYFQYNSCYESKECGDIEEQITEILEYIDENKVDKFVIDIRNNSGGRGSFIDSLIEGIKERNINDSNKLFVIVGRGTFSAAIQNAADLREETNATFVGEPTSQRVNHSGEVTHFILPNSRIGVTCSTKQIDYYDDNGDSFVPDKIINISIEDYVNKKDPVLDYILEK